MKRQPILLALAPLLVVGAALWGVNYRLDHPPLTKADKEFRALVAGADKVEIKTLVCQPPMCSRFSHPEYRTLNAEQTRELIDSIRLIDRTPAKSPLSRMTQDVSVSILTFKSQGKMLLPQVTLHRMISWNKFHLSSGIYDIHPRFNKRLNRTLDAYLPQRIRP